MIEDVGISKKDVNIPPIKEYSILSKHDNQVYSKIPSVLHSSKNNKNDVNIPTCIDTNIPSNNITINTNKPNYNLSEIYDFIDVVRRKITLRIHTGNEKNSYTVTLY